MTQDNKDLQMQMILKLLEPLIMSDSDVPLAALKTTDTHLKSCTSLTINTNT